MYPYPMNDNLTSEKADRNYHIIYMENDFVRIGVMPGLGGRIFEAIDKTNGYNFFYRQHVIKPSLIGMVGFWVSGSLAWGYPHHHGPNTVEPMDYRIEENTDGSVTLWMAYTEMRHRLRILYGYTMYPNSSRVEMTIRPSNPTPYMHSFLFWANPSVHCDTSYQVIFPPSVEYVTHHHKRMMTTWPVADRPYGGYDYTGQRIDLWKNTGVPSSFFAWDPQEDFFGGYDHRKQAGTAWTGNHHLCTGMKYWADGNNPAGEMINEGLTDDDGRYIELMAGAYTDNQPDYSWLQPGEQKDVTMTWYPIRDLGGMICANSDLAMNLVTGREGEVSLRLNATRPIENLAVVLNYDGREVHRESIRISPADPYIHDFSMDRRADSTLFSVTCLDREGRALLEYHPRPRSGKPIPEALEPPVPPQKVETVEELYLTGARLDQFFNAPMDPVPYYLEALRRDPGDTRVNFQLGIRALKYKKFTEAEEYLHKAAGRITMRYARPRDSDAIYNLALAKRRLGKRDEAYDLFYDATWNLGWHTSGYLRLAEMDCENEDYTKALDHIDRAISTNTNDLGALNLKVSILRKLDRMEETEELATQNCRKDVLNHRSRNELYLVARSENKRKAGKILEELERIMGGRVQSYLELAASYACAGLYEEGYNVLSRAEQRGEPFPLVYYYMGYFRHMLGDPEGAGNYFATASGKPHNYCFPYRDETIDVLQTALDYNEKDAMALYYLGNLYYEYWPEMGISLWEKSQAIEPDFYIVQRNLALAARAHLGDPGGALELYGKAFAGKSDDPRLMYEYDQACAEAGIPPAERYTRIFEGRREFSKLRSDCFLKEIELLVFLGRYDEAIDILIKGGFVVSEGEATLRDLFHHSHILRSLRHYINGDVARAVEDMKTALEYPIGRWGTERRAQMNYLLGTYYEKMGETGLARAQYQKAAAEHVGESEYLYDKGMALIKLGMHDLAVKQFQALLQRADRKEGSDFFRSFERMEKGITADAQKCYLRGLAFRGMGRNTASGEQFRQALGYNPAHVWADFYLNNSL